MRIVLSILLLLLVLADGATRAASVETREFVLADQTTPVDLYAPDAGPVRGLAVIAHGFTRSRARHRVLAGRLANEGFVVAVPNLRNWFSRAADADAIVDLVKMMEGKRGLGSRPVVLIGTSAGGLATLLAADRVPRLALWVGLDPVDALGTSKSVARRLQAPALVLGAPSGPCNAGGSAKRIAGWLANRRAELRIDGASHCDFEDTTNWRCESVCGRAHPKRQALIVDEAVRAVLAAVPR
jgi:dienelactone hydrolase